MLINKAYKFRLLPNNEQEIMLKKHIGCTRYAFNWALEKKKNYYEQNKKALPYLELSRLWTQHKQENKFLGEVSKWVTANALRNVEKAFTNFFRRLKQGQKFGHPKFKSRKLGKQTCSFTNNETTIEISNNKIKLPIVSWLRLKKHREVIGKILSATVSFQAGRWFVSVLVRQELTIAKNSGVPVGIDVGISHFATLSTGEKIYNPRYLENSLKLLRRRSKQLSKKAKDSKNREKARTKLTILHWRIANRRRDFLNKVSCDLAKNYTPVICENLAIFNMLKNSRLARNIADASWSEFYRQLAYKCRWYGSEFRQISRWVPSSKTCNVCGEINRSLKLSDREWVCNSCGSTHDRDENASKNILAVGYTATAC